MLARIVQLLGMIDSSEPSRARIIHDAIQYVLFIQNLIIDGPRKKETSHTVTQSSTTQSVFSSQEVFTLYHTANK